MLSKLFSICIFMMVVTMVTAVNHNRVCQEDKLKRPRQFRMQVYSKPNQKGAVQTMRVTNGLSTPCWNLSSKRVGSFSLNDPLVRVTFYRSSDCKGIASAVYSQSSRNQNHVMVKAKSVSITKIKPVMDKNKCK